MEEKTVKAIEHDREKRKEILLTYLTKRRDYIQKMMQDHFTENGAIDQRQMEVYFCYNSIISDVKDDRLES